MHLHYTSTQIVCFHNTHFCRQGGDVYISHTGDREGENHVHLHVESAEGEVCTWKGQCKAGYGEDGVSKVNANCLTAPGTC